MLKIVSSADPTLSRAIWIDLLEPSEDERAQVEQATRLRLPTREAIEEIESSSRVYIENGALYLSTPVLTTTDCMNATVTAIGFVLSRSQLVTVRFAGVTAIDAAAARDSTAPATSAHGAFLVIMEAIIDATADALEHANAQLEAISHAAFHIDKARHRPAKASGALREALRKLGRMGDGISHIRGTLLGLGRIAAFVHESGGDVHMKADLGRSNVIRADIVSLNDFQAHLSSKVQFLLDATLGFINIEQNDIVKMLTVVSVAGVPPVLIAGIYGMNFRRMPELAWAFGYPYALILIVLSALVPVAWLKWRGWM